MNKPLKIVKIGNSAGVVLPKDLLEELGVEQGDQLTTQKTEDGIELRRYEADFEAQMEVAREVMRKRRSALRQLAK